MSLELKVPKRILPADAGKSSKKKKLAFSRKAKFVLFLGDEGAILIYLKGNTVQSRQFVPDASQENLHELQQSITKNSSAPISLVIDSMDQSYMQQTLPPVSTLSVNKLIKRRLDRDFSGNDIKGAILLGREKTGRKDWNFLMVALEKSPQMTIWMDFLQQLPNRFSGIYLAAVEAETLVQRLEQNADVLKDNEPTEWKFFVSHNKVGGFRQVILRNNRIVFTRLAQPVGDSSAEIIAGSIEQEMLSTIEYMKRLSFSPQSKLAIYIVTSNSIKSVIDPSKFNAHIFHVFTPYEVAEVLGIEGAAQPTDQFGDVVLAATIGCSKKHVLRLTAPQIKRVDNIYQLILSQRIFSVIALLGILGYSFYTTYEIVMLVTATGELTDIKSGEQRSLEKLRKDITTSSVDVEKASELIDAYQALMKERTSPLPFIKQLEPILKYPVSVKSLDWTVGMENNAGANRATAMPVAGQKTDSTVSLLLVVEFPPDASDPKLFKVLSKKILGTLRDQFKGFEVKYLGLPESARDVGKIEVSSMEKEEIEVPKSLDIQISIKGDIATLSTQGDSVPLATATPAIAAPPSAQMPTQPPASR